MITRNDWGYLAALAKACVTKQDWDGAKILYESQKENIPQMHFDKDLWESENESHQFILDNKLLHSFIKWEKCEDWKKERFMSYMAEAYTHFSGLYQRLAKSLLT